MTLRRRLEERATELGFARFGVARVEPLERDAQALGRWLAGGMHGSMQWMESAADVRVDPRHEGMLPSARSVVALVTPYGGQPSRRGPPPGVVARYARGRDYHNVLRRRAKKRLKILREAGHVARASVDTLPVLERAWAQRAGVGFIGKNACLIAPGLGSHVFLTCLVTDAELAPDEPMSERCGDCTACLRACPTDAFPQPRVVDARRCVSYLTIEHRGPIEPSLREGIGDRIFGCDDCQDVCPFNAAAGARRRDPAFDDHERLETPAASLLEMSEAEHLEFAHGSPLRRAGRDSLARNAALVLGNHGSRVHLPVLQRARDADPRPDVREAAAWAVSKIEAGATNEV